MQYMEGITIYSGCYTLEEIRRVFKIDCFQKDSEVFNKTHFTLYFTFQDPQEPEYFTNEDHFLSSQWSRGIQERKKSGDWIRPYIAWGATGTGKTEFCRWLELNIKHPDYETLRFSKRDLAMGGVLGIAQTLSDERVDLGERLLARHAGLGAEDVAIVMLGNLIDQGKILVSGIDKDEILRMLKTHIRLNIEKRVEQVRNADDISRIESNLEFITNNDLRVLSSYNIKFDLNRVNREIFRALTQFIATVDDVKRLLFKYIKKKNAEGKIPVLLFDDVTHIGDIIDDFLSVIVDITGGNEEYVCDFVIGTTTDFYYRKIRDTIPSSAKARLFEVKFSPEDRDIKNAGWLLGERGLNNFLDFTTKYLSASRECSKCKEKYGTFCTDKSLKYYPFTQTFLINLYNRLFLEKDERQQGGLEVCLTPRFIIQTLRSSLLKFIEESIPPSTFIDEFLILNSVNFFKISSRKKKEHGNLLSVIWWYGQHDESGTVCMEKKLLEQLGMDYLIPEDLRDQSVLTYETIPMKLSIPRIPVPLPRIGGDEGLDDVRFRSLIEDWYNGKSVRIPTTFIVDGFNSVVKTVQDNLPGSQKFRNLMNFRSSRRGTSIEYTYPGNREVGFWFGNLKDDIRQIYILKRSNEQMLKPLIEEKGFQILFVEEDDVYLLHKIGEAEKEGTNPELYINEYLMRNFDEISQMLWEQRRRLFGLIEGALGCSIQTYILSTFILVNKIGKREARYYEINCLEDVLSLLSFKWDEDFSIYSDVISKSFSNILMKKDVIMDLFYSFFALRGKGSILDYPIIEKSFVNKLDNGKWLDVIDKVQIKEDRFRIRNHGDLYSYHKSFKTLINDVNNYFTGIKNDVIKTDIEELNAALQLFLKKDALMKNLQSMLNLLKSTNYRYEYMRLEGLILEIKEDHDINILKISLNKIQNLLDNINDKFSLTLLYAEIEVLKKHDYVNILNRLNSFLNNFDIMFDEEMNVDITGCLSEYDTFITLNFGEYL